ncbi:LLM class flavin-dependent oxidoreductase [Nocardioides sp. zg-579]|uniref:LLM class flavin-dependent oxidoreductase n=1 Tax=Nocardioides marmotae TaxID=2663857 RepID=A0A6I3JBR9_9ACTN|nr:LLM class flavin-dependent oxidoreductase [Nocardioides marmotae]MCR6031881.1 LLM class flavin-dependent oxidoreductase [Gordonia jinghuaiqii]MTB95521.1 LLM class flavin-dependent oxidoreductase [Nocardioides marmotae]QKE00948.1 LLM class flavin-dependent oxidoreductase [Nocardioides marmotae]
MEIQLGLDTFGDVTVGPDGALLPHAEVVRDVVAQGRLADEVGVDAFGIGEHHRDDYAVSAPDVVLAGLATTTERIRLGSAVTVLSSDDPVRVMERFATIDALSGGRAEVTLGRGSFTESFPLFGFDLADYEVLFSEKLDLFARLRLATAQGEPLSWEGQTRAPLVDARVWPAPANPLRTWVAVGGSPESVVRSARYGLPLMLAIIGGEPARFAPYVDLYHRALDELGQPRLPVGVHSPGFVARTDAEARERLFPHFKANRDRIGRERGWPPATRAQLDAEADQGALFVGSPETVARKIAATVRVLGIDRFDLKYSHGPLPHDHLMECIELYGTEVAPRVRELLAD